MSSGQERFVSDAGFATTSRFLDGHFPGQPVVPGAIILGYLAARLAASGRAIARVERMKFLKPLLPERPFEVLLTPGPLAAHVEFRDAVGAFAIAKVVLRPVDG